MTGFNGLLRRVLHVTGNTHPLRTPGLIFEQLMICHASFVFDTEYGIFSTYI